MAKRKAKNSPAAKLPAGFTATSANGNFGEWHDFEKNPVLTGECVGIHTIDGKWGKQRVMEVKVGKAQHSVSETKALQGLFDTKNINGREVYIEFLGEVPGKRGRTFKKFLTGVK